MITNKLPKQDYRVYRIEDKLYFVRHIPLWEYELYYRGDKRIIIDGVEHFLMLYEINKNDNVLASIAKNSPMIASHGCTIDTTIRIPDSIN